MRWERTPYGQTGHYIDMALESRIGFLVEAAEALKARELVALASEASEHLTVDWSHTIPDFPAVIRLLDKISACGWVLEYGGRVVYQNILNELLNNLEFARASDWLELLTFADRGAEWADADGGRLAVRFKRYQSNGCSTSEGTAQQWMK